MYIFVKKGDLNSTYLYGMTQLGRCIGNLLTPLNLTILMRIRFTPAILERLDFGFNSCWTDFLYVRTKINAFVDIPLAFYLGVGLVA